MGIHITVGGLAVVVIAYFLWRGHLGRIGMVVLILIVGAAASTLPFVADLGRKAVELTAEVTQLASQVGGH